MSKIKKRNFINILFFPVKMLNKDKVLYIWICTTLIGGLFTFFSDILVGKENVIKEVVDTGGIYVFAITLLIPIVADIIIYVYTLVSTREMNDPIEGEPNEDNLPFHGGKSIALDVLIILALIIITIIISILLFIGIYKTQLNFQIVFASISFYLSFYYYCLCRLSQNRDYFNKKFNDYSNNENQNIQDLIQNAGEITERQQFEVVKEVNENNEGTEASDEFDEEMNEIISNLNT